MYDITFIGDSITMGWATGWSTPPSVAVSQTWPYRLLVRLEPSATITQSTLSPWSGGTDYLVNGTNKVLTGTNYRVYNAGIGNNETSQMVARFSTDVLGHHSNVLYILGGVNDIAHGTATNLQCQSNLQWLCEQAITNSITPVLCTILPWNNGTSGQRDRVDAINTWIRSYCTSAGIVCVDLFAAMESPAGSRTSPWYSDGVHPNATGYQKMADAMPMTTATFPALSSPVGVHTSVRGTVSTLVAGTIKLSGVNANRFDLSLDGTTFNQTVTVPAGTSQIYLGVTPQNGDKNLSVKIGVPV